jgi:hypothetical protein
MYHKYEGMTDMLRGTMMEELTNIITCVTGDARHRRTIYEADQDFERFGKTLIANFKNTATLWEFLKRLASGSKDTKNPNAITRKRMKQPPRSNHSPRVRQLSDSRCFAAQCGSTAPGRHGHQTTPR